MKQACIRILGPLWEQVRRESLGSSMDESVAFFTANYFEVSDKVIFLGETVVPAKSGDYLKRGELHLQISPLYVSRVLNVAEDKGSTVVMVHSHPFENGKPQYSATDDFGEAQTSETIARCLGNSPPVGSLLFGQSDATARAWRNPPGKYMNASVTVLGAEQFQRYFEFPSSGLPTNELVDRQVRALGQQVQKLLESLEVGIVGLGGTGSSIAEQLVRMGVKDLVLVDHDVFEPSNWSRLYGSRLKDASEKIPKVKLVSAHLRDINPAVSCSAIQKSVMTRTVLERLAGCDVIFSCLDRHAPRAVLNEVAYQCYVPVIDVGVGLVRDDTGTLSGSARATLIGPNMPCLFCQELIRPEMITAEHLSPAEYKRRRAEGYVTEVGSDAPSVISYTTMASSFGLMLFLDFISERGSSGLSTLLFDLKTKETLKLRTKIKLDCVCQKRLGQGLRMPFSVAE